jgi:hypothetical protein
MSHWELTQRLSFQDIRGLLGKYKLFPWRISLKASIPPNFSVQNQLVYSNLPLPLDGQMQTGVSLPGIKLLWTLTASPSHTHQSLAQYSMYIPGSWGMCSTPNSKKTFRFVRPRPPPSMLETRPGKCTKHKTYLWGVLNILKEFSAEVPGEGTAHLSAKRSVLAAC